MQLVGHTDYPAVIVEQVPHPHLLSYAGLACEQSQTELDHHQLLKGQCTQHTRALAFLYLSHSHFMIGAHLPSASPCYGLLNSVTFVLWSFDSSFTQIKSHNRYYRKPVSARAQSQASHMDHPPKKIQEVKQNIPGLCLGKTVNESY